MTLNDHSFDDLAAGFPAMNTDEPVVDFYESDEETSSSADTSSDTTSDTSSHTSSSDTASTSTSGTKDKEDGDENEPTKLTNQIQSKMAAYGSGCASVKMPVPVAATASMVSS
ncbi:hypothetical protein HK097_009327 [Rhizophlyctis rosea]|uniref:Uncharacterized protein n=1 Tax=Rhizophlyctis rosea TaxID=64517 RepID=A0AAD5SBB0_9FUNG|nr:hypothetical protein HK097_009327 [Rhizophlyctis rosea]